MKFRNDWVILFAAMFGLLALLAFTGCTGTAKKLNRIVAPSQERTRELIQGADVANRATAARVDYIAGAAATSTNTEIANAAKAAQKSAAVAGNQLSRAGAIIGTPAKDQTEHVAGLLTNAPAALAVDAARANEESAWAVEKRALEAKLLEYGEKYEAERNKSIVKRFWLWATGTFGLMGAIAFIIFCPAIALPLLGRVLAWLVSAVPKVGSFMGLVGHNVVAGIVAGVEKAKGAIEEKAKATLETELSKAMDSGPKKVVRELRNA